MKNFIIVGIGGRGLGRVVVMFYICFGKYIFIERWKFLKFFFLLLYFNVFIIFVLNCFNFWYRDRFYLKRDMVYWFEK